MYNDYQEDYQYSDRDGEFHDPYLKKICQSKKCVVCGKQDNHNDNLEYGEEVK